MYKPLYLNHNGKQPKNCYVIAAGSHNIPVRSKTLTPSQHVEGRIVFIQNGLTEFEKNDGTIIKAKGGEVIIFSNSKDIRYVTSHNCEDFTVYFQEIQKIMPEFPLFAQNFIRISLSKVEQEKLLVYFNNIINEFQLQEYGYEFALNVNLMRILLLALRTKQNTTNNFDLSKIKPALFDMRNNYSKTMPLKYYASLCNMSLSAFQHTFTKLMNVTPIQYLNNIKISNAAFLLAESEFTVLEISTTLGFSNVTYFSNLFKKHYGIGPNAYRKKHK